MKESDVLMLLASDAHLGNLLADGTNVAEASALLSRAVASIRHHSLLSESSVAPVASGLKAKHNVDASRAANDAWIAKVFGLISSSVVCSFREELALLVSSSKTCNAVEKCGELFKICVT
jgi:hypothetical protein